MANPRINAYVKWNGSVDGESLGTLWVDLFESHFGSADYFVPREFVGPRRTIPQVPTRCSFTGRVNRPTFRIRAGLIFEGQVINEFGNL